MEKTMGFAKSLNKNRMYTKEMRHRLYKDILFALDVEDVSRIEPGRLTVG